MLIFSAMMSALAGLAGLIVASSLLRHPNPGWAYGGHASAGVWGAAMLVGVAVLWLKATMETRAAAKLRDVATVPLHALPGVAVLAPLAQVWTLAAAAVFVLTVVNVALAVLGVLVILIGLPVSLFTQVTMDSVFALSHRLLSPADFELDVLARLSRSPMGLGFLVVCVAVWFALPPICARYVDVPAARR